MFWNSPNLSDVVASSSPAAFSREREVGAGFRTVADIVGMVWGCGRLDWAWDVLLRIPSRVGCFECERQR